MIDDLPRFMDELCVRLGICLAPEARARIALTQYRDIDAMEEAILEAEGIDPLRATRRLRHDLREMVSRHWT